MTRPQTIDGSPLVPGHNVDHVDIARGLEVAEEIGFDSDTDQMIVGYSLNLWRRGEESRAENNFLHYLGAHNLTSWTRIISAATARQDQKESPKNG